MPSLDLSMFSLALPVGTKAHLVIDADPNRIVAIIFQRPERRNYGYHIGSLIEELAGPGPTSITLDLQGLPIPFVARVTVRDMAGGFPAEPVDTVTDYDMGPSNKSQSIDLASDQHYLWRVEALRKF